MASEWELGMGMGFGYGVGIGASVSPSLVASAHAPKNYQPAMNSSAYLYGLPSTDTLRIDDLLDFSNHHVYSSSSSSAANTDGLIIPKQEATTGCGPFVGESGSSRSHVTCFADDIYIPTEEAAELEWLSKFVEESFSDVPYPSNYLPAAGEQIRVDPAAAAAPGRGARSKRSRAASKNFTPPTLVLQNQSSSSSSTSSSSSSDFPTPAHVSAGGASSRKNAENEGLVRREGGARRCTHCASEKTPQWRTGPLGPKTLCNACGVRYKSGRLVPEYRPAASPSFVLTQHSNSHRKVMELRRQKEQIHSYNQNPNPSNSSAAAAGNALIYH